MDNEEEAESEMKLGWEQLSASYLLRTMHRDLTNTEIWSM